MPVFASETEVPVQQVQTVADEDVIRVIGTVIDTKNELLVGATITIKGTKKTVVADIEGKFIIDIPRNGVIQVSYLGMKTQERVCKDTKMTVILEDDATLLNEVVAIGYGTMKRSDITGSVVSIDSEALSKRIATTMDQALQGRAAGVHMTQNTGIPGGSTSVLIRGVNSLNSSNEPIYVVDGVVISGSTGNNTQNATANINPSDIESIEILKDASATAIYGAQAANGVILITMKKGKKGQPKVSFNGYYGFQHIANRVDIMDLPEYASWFNDYLRANPILGMREFYAYPERLNKGTDWQDEIFSTAAIQSYNLSVRGGGDQGNYSVSGGFFDQDGIAVNSGFKRATLRLQVDFVARPWLRIGSSMDFAYSKQNLGMAEWSIIGNVLYTEPSILVKDASGNWTAEDEEITDVDGMEYNNPVAVSSVTTRTMERFSGRGNIYVEINPLRWLRYRTEFAGDAGVDKYLEFIPEYTFGYTRKAFSESRHERNVNYFYVYKNELNFDYNFGGKHHTTLLVGHEMSSWNLHPLMAKRTHGDRGLTGINAGNANYSTNSGNSYKNNFMSFFGRAFYNYMNKYMLTATVRHDGSSNFARDNRWGTFPSFAAGWRVSEEPFFNPAKKTMNNLKLRLGYGLVGNSNTSNFAYKSMLNTTQSIFGVAYNAANMANKDLKWESTRSWNLGVDMSLFDNKVELIVDVYDKKTKDLLLQTVSPDYTGTDGPGSTSSMWANIGTMSNKGIELTLNTHNIRTKDFEWNTGLTFSRNKNKVIAINTENGYIDKIFHENGEVTLTRTAPGHGVSEFFGYNFIGRINDASDYLKDNGDGTSTVIMATPDYRVGSVIKNTDELTTSVGDFLFEDINKDGIIDEKDRTYLGSPLPKFTYGINNTFRYKDFDLSVFLYGSYGNKVLNLTNRRLLDPNRFGNHLSRVLNYAKVGYKDGDSDNKNIWNYRVESGDSDLSRMTYRDANDNSRISNRLVEGASYLRIQNIVLGYTIPSKYLKKLTVERARIYVNVQNLYTFTGYSGFDPEVGATQGQYSFSGQDMLLYGVDIGRSPVPRAFTFGIDVTF